MSPSVATARPPVRPSASSADAPSRDTEDARALHALRRATRRRTRRLHENEPPAETPWLRWGREE